MAAIVLFSVAIGLMGFSLAGYGSNALDLAPIYNGSLFFSLVQIVKNERLLLVSLFS